MNTGPLTVTRENLSEIVDSVVATSEAYVITKHGRPAVVLVSYDEYEALLETLNILSDDDTMAALAEADLDIADGRVDEIAE